MTLVDFLYRSFRPFMVGILVCCSLALNSQTGFAQEPTLTELQQQWSEMDAKFAAKQVEIESGEGDSKQLRSEFRDLVDQANAMAKQIKATALSLLKENPRDSTATRAVLGVLLNDAENGRDKEVLSVGDVLISHKIDPRYLEAAAKVARLPIGGREIFEELLIRQRETNADDLPRVKLTTTKGDIVLELYENQAPNTVRNFITLIENGHYSDILFHRVLEGFMAQAGEKKSDGKPATELGYTIACECYTPETRPHFSHCLSLAHAGKNTGGGQFFLTFSRTSMLDGRHTCFGRIIEGGDVLDRIERTHIAINGDEEPIPNVEKDKIISVEVIRKRDHDYQPTKFGQKTPETVNKLEKPPADPNLTEGAEKATEPTKEKTDAELKDNVDKKKAAAGDEKELELNDEKGNEKANEQASDKNP